MKWWTAASIAALVVACSKTDSVVCGDGTVCPSGTVCLAADRAPNRCVLEEQTEVCTGHAEGSVCQGEGFIGICSDNVCLPGCGDGVQQAGEQCDDGNFASHDGCSSSCLTEAPTWGEYHGPWHARTLLAHAYDATSGTLVLFGGVTAEGQDGATWIFDAQGVRRLEGNGPPGLAGASMVFDSFRGVFVLFGGHGIDGAGTAETWELSGGQWHKATPTMSPPRRTLAGMAFDTQRKKTILFGGTTDDTVIEELNDTWEYNGTTWVNLNLTAAPVTRFAPAMAYDPFRHQVVLFGGRHDVGRRGDTWLFSSTTGTWSEVTPSAPPGRERSAMAFFPPNNTMMMFGGQLPGQNSMNDLWEFNGTSWTQVTTTVSPPPRDEHALEFVDGNLMAIGGEATRLYDDVWKLDTTAATIRWRTVDLGLVPEARTTSLAYDSDNHAVLAYGGAPVALLSPADFWAFDAHGWRRVATGLPARGTNPTAYDSAGHRLVTVGGSNANGTPVQTTDAWNGNAWVTIAPSPVLPELRNPALAFDDAGLGLLFGGDSDSSGVQQTFGDTYELTGTTWTKTVAAGAGPPPAASAALVYDPTRKVFLLASSDGKTWSYANHAWAPLPTDESPPGREGEQLIYDDVRKQIVMLGGFDSTTFYTNDLWQLDRDANGVDAWHLLNVVGEGPPPRHQTRAAYSPRLRGIVMFGGSDPTRLNDTWLLRFASATPDEDCNDGKDNDFDLQVDTDDPDCQEP